MEGLGAYKWTNGQLYQGEWSRSKMHGVGFYTWSDGRIYLGEYEDQKKQGYGVYKMTDSKLFQGNWANGKQHGLGLFLRNGIGSVGLWESGTKIHQFNKTTVQAIIQGQVDYQEYFNQKAHRSNPKNKMQSYYSSNNFEQKVKAIS
jgi:hypothetical protein